MNEPVLSLFSGVGGIELGLHRAGVGTTVGFYESWDPARSVLAERFPDTAIFGDIANLTDFHGAGIVTAGFPCTDLSQAGRTQGLDGSASGLIRHVLELLGPNRPDWLLIENVPNMLHLGRGKAMAEIARRIEAAGYDWAYRTIDSRSFGLPQRRRRVYLLASPTHDPAAVLFRSDSPGIRPNGAAAWARDDAYGFYWTEGNRGLGWAIDAVPTLKGSTTLSIPSPPAAWLPDQVPGEKLVRPSIESAERLQGLPAGWTSPAPLRDRWKLVGNAVSVPVAHWIGEGLAAPGAEAVFETDRSELPADAPWPTAAHHTHGKTWQIDVSEWPVEPCRTTHLRTLLDEHGSEPLSHRATKGFRDRLDRSSLRHEKPFMEDLTEHVELTAV